MVCRRRHAQENNSDRNQAILPLTHFTTTPQTLMDPGAIHYIFILPALLVFRWSFLATNGCRALLRNLHPQIWEVVILSYSLLLPPGVQSAALICWEAEFGAIGWAQNQTLRGTLMDPEFQTLRRTLRGTLVESRIPHSDPEFRTLDPGFESRIPDSNPEFRIPDSSPEFRIRIQNPEFRIPDSGFESRIPDSNPEFRIPDSGFRIPVSGFRIPDSSPEIRI